MLENLIKKNTIELDVVVSNWEDAVRKSGELLRKSDAIENRYIDAMIDMAKKIGPYITISKGVAFPHARPEDGVLNSAMSLITLKDPVMFGDIEHDPIKIVISFCSVDPEGHLRALSELVNLLKDEKAINAIINSKSKNEIIEIIKNLK